MAIWSAVARWGMGMGEEMAVVGVRTTRKTMRTATRTKMGKEWGHWGVARQRCWRREKEKLKWRKGNCGGMGMGPRGMVGR